MKHHLSFIWVYRILVVLSFGSLSCNLYGQVDLYNNISATDYHSIRISRGTYLWYYAQRFTTTNAAYVDDIELVLRKSNATARGTCYIHLFTDKDNEPLAYWNVEQFQLETLDTVFTRKVYHINQSFLPNTNYWVALICYANTTNAWLDWANTNTPYPAPTSYAKISNGSESWSVSDTRNTPRIMRVTAHAVAAPTVPTVQSSGIYFSNLLNYQADIGWIYGNGDYNIVFIKETTTGAPSVTNNTTYAANPIFGQGSTDGNGWYCVYKGTDNTFTVSGLTPGATYRVMVLDFNGILGQEKYNMSQSASNPANFTTLTACASLPGNAGDINGSSIVCAGSNGLAYSTKTILSATSYHWTYSGTGATINGTGNTITINFSDKATDGILRVNGRSDCGDGPPSAEYPITINPLPDDAGLITGALNVVRGNTGISYSIPVLSNATSYVWLYSGMGATIHGTGSNVTMDFSSSAVSGILAVRGRNSCGDGALSSFFPITVNILPGAAGSITGSSSVCAGTFGIKYSTNEISNATSYLWEYSGTGATINGNGSKEITIDFSSGATDGNLTVKGNNFAGDGAVSVTYHISLDYTPSNAGPVVGTPEVCAGNSGISYSIDSINYATSYIWNYSNTGVNILGQGKIVTLDFSKTAASGNLTIRGHNTCGDGASSNYPVIVNPLPGSSSSINGFSTLCAGTTGLVYSINAMANATTYNWAYSGTNAVINGNGLSVTIDLGKLATSGILSVKGHNACGDGTPVELPLIVNPLAGTAGYITGIANVCDRSSEIFYTTDDIPQATSYIWNYSGTGSVINGSGKSVAIKFLNGSTDGYITVKGRNACGDGELSEPYPVTVGTYPDKPFIGGAPSSKDKVLFCAADTIVCSNYNPFFSYQWYKQAIPVAEGTGNKLILGGDGTGTYSLLATNRNCSRVSDSLVITVNNTEKPEVIRKQGGGITILLVNNENNNFEWYRWTLADNSNIPGSIDTYKQFLVLDDSQNNSYKVSIMDKMGCRAVSDPVTLENAVQKSAMAYPVVNNGNFEVELKGPENGSVAVEIIGSTGIRHNVFHFEKTQENASFPIVAGNLPEGLYILAVHAFGTKELIKIVVKK